MSILGLFVLVFTCSASGVLKRLYEFVRTTIYPRSVLGSFQQEL
jgi:hypothetical protein